MREIKFRAWDKITEKFIEQADLKISGDNVIYYCDICDTALIVMQYTGLKDRQGREIYEGDIVKFDYRGLFLKGEVVFSNGGWELKGVDYGEHFRLIEIVHLCEVVGNIYENKRGC